jgi:hypothetical protein
VGCDIMATLDHDAVVRALRAVARELDAHVEADRLLASLGYPLTSKALSRRGGDRSSVCA